MVYTVHYFCSCVCRWLKQWMDLYIHPMFQPDRLWSIFYNLFLQDICTSTVLLCYPITFEWFQRINSVRLKDLQTEYEKLSNEVSQASFKYTELNEAIEGIEDQLKYAKVLCVCSCTVQYLFPNDGILQRDDNAINLLKCTITNHSACKPLWYLIQCTAALTSNTKGRPRKAK